jgi:GNAT superfamily N-acetyltransferase
VQTEVALDADVGIAAIEMVLGQYRYGRYLEDRSLPETGARLLLRDTIEQHLGRPHGKSAFAFSRAGDVVGIILFRLSEWDSEYFGWNVAIVDSLIVQGPDDAAKSDIALGLLNRFHDWCRSADVRFVSARIPALDLPVVHSFEALGFRYIESWIFNKYDLRKKDERPQCSFELRLAEPKDLAIMSEYSNGAFASQRFHADPHIPVEKAEQLYRNWIKTAFDDPNQKILVHDVSGRPAAFLIYFTRDLRKYFDLQFAMWKMALLDPSQRGRGMGTEFLWAMLDYHRTEGLDVVDSGLSMRNQDSLNLHNKVGFKVVSTLVTFHKWLS